MSADQSPSWYRMVLYQADLETPPVDVQHLREHLRRCGLLGESFEFAGETFYGPGEGFLDLVVFLGCSPVIELQPQFDDHGRPRMGAFCHVRLPPSDAAPQLYLGDAAASPRCPHCRVSIRDWQAWLPQWQAQPLAPVWRCPACDAPAAAATIHWRQAAGVCRTRIELGGIHPYEAVPADPLLACLEQAGGGRWKHFYVRP